MESSTSSLKKFIQNVDEQCEKHLVNKQKIKGKEMPAVCPICQKEDLAERNRQLTEKAERDAKKYDTYCWLNRLSIYSDMTLKGVSFEKSEVPKDGEQRENFKIGYQIAKQYIDDEKFNTVMAGNAGAGKSHLAMCVLNEVNEQSEELKRCLFISIDELMRNIKDSFNNKYSSFTERYAIELINTADLVVLDDLGAEIGLVNGGSQSSDFVARTLTAILSGRQSKPTIITTNLTKKEIEQKYDSRISSRVNKGGNYIVFSKTEDQRK